MTRIALVVSDVDGTLLTKDKTLTDRAKAAVRRLHDAGIGFTITSSRPTIGMRFLIEPLAITLPVGAFNGSCIVDPQLNVIEQHLIPASAAQQSLDVLNEFDVDIWLFTSDLSVNEFLLVVVQTHSLRDVTRINRDRRRVTRGVPIPRIQCRDERGGE